MPYPVTHVLVPMFLVEMYRRYVTKGKLSHWYVLLAGFAGGAADFDVILGWLTGGYYQYHRLFTHSIFLALIFAAIGVGIYLLGRNRMIKKRYAQIGSKVMLIISIAFLTHSMLDCTDGLRGLLYPFYEAKCFNWLRTEERAAILDGVLLFGWILFNKPFKDDLKRFWDRIRSKMR